MSIFDWFRSKTSLQRELKASRDANVALTKAMSATRVFADLLNKGPNLGQLSGAWTDNRTEQVRHYKYWTYVAISAIADKVSQLTPNISVLKKSPPHQHKWLRGAYRQKALAKLHPDEDLEPVERNHPLRHLLEYPNEVDTAWDIWYETIIFLKLTGNAYWWIPVNGMDKPAEIWVIPSHWVWPVVGRERLVEEYEIRPVEGGYKRLVFPADEIIHIRSKSPISKIDGYSPLTAGARWIDQMESCDQARWHTYKQGSFPSTVIELGGDYADPSDEDILRIEQKFLARYQGERRAGKPIILPPGLKLTPLMVSAREMDYVQSFEQLRDTCLALFKVSKVIVGITTEVNRASLEGAQFGFCQFTVNPLLKFLGEALTCHLAHRFDEDLVLWWDDCSPDDKAQLNADIQVDIAARAITPNEIRSLRGRPAFEHGGDDPMGTMGEVPIPFGTGEQAGGIPLVTQGDVTTIQPGQEISGGHADGEAEKSMSGKVLDVPDVRQKDEFDCGAAALKAALDYYQVKPSRSEEEMVRALGSDEDHGTLPKAILREAKDAGLGVEESSGMSLAELTQQIDNGNLVICPVQAYGTDDEERHRESGHYVVVCGYTPTDIILHDPSAGRQSQPRREFLTCWHDQDANGVDYHHYGIVVSRNPLGNNQEADMSWIDETGGGSLVGNGRHEQNGFHGLWSPPPRRDW